MQESTVSLHSSARLPGQAVTEVRCGSDRILKNACFGFFFSLFSFFSHAQARGRAEFGGLTDHFSRQVNTTHAAPCQKNKQKKTNIWTRTSATDPSRNRWISIPSKETASFPLPIRPQIEKKICISEMCHGQKKTTIRNLKKKRENPSAAAPTPSLPSLHPPSPVWLPGR